MIKETYKVIGLMSGTSLDGLDIAYCEFTKAINWSFKILETTTINYDKKWKSRLQNCMAYNENDLQSLDIDLGVFWGTETQNFIQKNKLKVDFIASHGHTVFHQPDKGITLQIGNAFELSQKTKCNIISDFRSIDVKKGGQGAPLVPIGDKMLFSEFQYCLNLGGISNVSFDNGKANRIAFDISPCNLILNYYANKKGYEFDENGNIAKTGNINNALLDTLNALEYYKLDAPKSLGKENIEQTFLPILENLNITIEDKLNTFVTHIGIQIGKQLKGGKTLITGGGAYNSFLIENIRKNTNTTIVLGNDELISFKEALIFAFLGVLKKREEINILNSYTGAKENSIAGIITHYK